MTGEEILRRLDAMERLLRRLVELILEELYEDEEPGIRPV